MSELRRRATNAVATTFVIALSAACGRHDMPPAAAVANSSADAGAEPSGASPSGSSASGAAGERERGSATSSSSSAAGTGDGARPPGAQSAITMSMDDAGVANEDPNAAVLDRTQWPAYPKVNFPVENPYSADKALLGKLLFWDEQLSSDDSTACGSCHMPAAGGSDPRPAQPGYLGNPGADGERGTADDPKGSPGIAACKEVPGGAPMTLMDSVFGAGPQVGRRRAMTVLDAMFWDSMFWDGRVGSALRDPISGELLIESGAALEAQALVPMMNTAEMACQGRDWQMAASKIAAVRPLALASDLPADLLAAQQSSASYRELFTKVFGDDAVTPARVVMAIATYERTLVADQTPWDRWRAGDDDALTDQQKHGFQVFALKGQCACCHTVPLFGLPQLVDDAFHEHSWDGGAAEMGMDKPGDYTNPRFRTVTVRNAGLREASGLLHDGVSPGTSLQELIAAYNKAPVRNVHFCRRALDLTQQEQTDLVAFVRQALTDPRAAAEAAPFDRPKLAGESKR